ncbi:MAG: TrkA family potassium uptake protein [Calditrichia bacterium]
MKKFAIIGLGAFGQSIALALTEKGAEVIAIDRDMSRVEDIQDYVSVAIRMDSTDEHTLKSQGIHEVDCAVVCIGEDFESNLLTAVLLKQLGVPRVITRATRSIEEKILSSVGIDQVVLPEQEIGEKLAYSLMHPKLKDIFYLSGEFNIVELEAPENLLGKTLEELRIRSKYNVNLITIRRSVVETQKDGTEIVRQQILMPAADTVIQESDILILFGKKQDIARLAERS